MPLQGWVNLESISLPRVDIIADLERCATTRLLLSDSSVAKSMHSHVLEHISAGLPLMQELWRTALPSARMTIRSPIRRDTRTNVEKT